MSQRLATLHPMAGIDPMQCTAHSKQTGAPCKKTAIPGSNVCVYHGGKAPQVQAAARRRILEAADPVAARLIDIALNSESDSAAVAAARDLLDRAGLGATHRIEAEVTHHEGDSELDRRIAALLDAMNQQDTPAA